MPLPKNVTEQRHGRRAILRVDDAAAVRGDEYGAPLDADFWRSNFAIDAYCGPSPCASELAPFVALYDELCADAGDNDDNDDARAEWCRAADDDDGGGGGGEATGSAVSAPVPGPFDNAAVAPPEPTSADSLRALVAVTGGVGSLAALWWTLRRRDVHAAHLCYLVGVGGACAPAELRALMHLVNYARDERGEPFADGARDVLRHPLARVKVLPMPAQPYAPRYADTVALDRRTYAGRASAARSLKYHPLTYALLYRQLVAAASAARCDAIVVGGAFGDARRLLAALHPLMHKYVAPHRLLMPFDTRADALAALCEGARHSSLLWAAELDAAAQRCEAVRRGGGDAASDDASSGAAASPQSPQSQQQHRRRTASTSGARGGGRSAAASVVDGVAWVRQTATCALMPDVADYVATCRTRESTSDAHDGGGAAPPSAPMPFGWCGHCYDCAAWWPMARRVDDALRAPHVDASPQTCYALPAEYAAFEQRARAVHERAYPHDHATAAAAAATTSAGAEPRKRARSKAPAPSTARSSKRTRTGSGTIAGAPQTRRAPAPIGDDASEVGGDRVSDNDGDDDDDDDETTLMALVDDTIDDNDDDERADKRTTTTIDDDGDGGDDDEVGGVGFFDGDDVDVGDDDDDDNDDAFAVDDDNEEDDDVDDEEAAGDNEDDEEDDDEDDEDDMDDDDDDDDEDDGGDEDEDDDDDDVDDEM